MNPDDDRPGGPDGWELPRELQSLEASLSALSPRDDRLDRERLMFFAGRASVQEAPDSSRKLLGQRWNQRAWPAAFAAMTAIAAALFVMLLIRPVKIEPPVFNIADFLKAPPATEQAVDARTSANRTMLSTRDARRRDIESLLSKDGLGAADANMEASPSIDVRDGATLTPAAWRQITDGSEFPPPPATDSSRASIHQGIKS